MSRLPELYQWRAIVASHFANLSKAQASGMALWSYGLIIARSCTLTAVTGTLAGLLGQSLATVRERLRDVYREAPAKAGRQRAELNLDECWAPWLSWVLEGWQSRQVALALDATTLGQRFVVLAISVLYRGCAVPVAWKILRPNVKHPWKPEWQALLRHFNGVLPPDKTVIVLTDRGLYAKWLYEDIRALGWHPLMRINAQGEFRQQGWYHWRRLAELVPAVGHAFAGTGIVFKNKPGQLACTLLGYWGQGHKEAWLVVTDLAPNAAQICWYGWRAWIEQGFKHLKRGGWHWHLTRVEQPERAERLWLVLALATWWVIAVGGEDEAQEPVPDATFAPVPGSARQCNGRWRDRSIFQRGLNLIVCAIYKHEPLPLGRGIPEPWPIWDHPLAPTEGRIWKNLHL